MEVERNRKEKKRKKKRVILSMKAFSRIGAFLID